METQEYVDVLIEDIETNVEEMFGIIESVVDDFPVAQAEVEQAKQVGLTAIRMYSKASAEEDSPLPHWLMHPDGLVLALTVSRFAAYSYLTAITNTETDSLERLLDDTRALFLGEGEEE